MSASVCSTCDGSSGGSDLFEANSPDAIGGLFPARWLCPPDAASLPYSVTPSPTHHALLCFLHARPPTCHLCLALSRLRWVLHMT